MANLRCYPCAGMAAQETTTSMPLQDESNRSPGTQSVQEAICQTLTEDEQCGIIVRRDGLVCCRFRKGGRWRYRPFIRVGPHDELWVLDPATGREHHVGQG